MTTELLRERYEPLEVVGRGGEGEVIRALDHLHGRQVALKVRRVAHEASRASLLSEARLLLSLSPHAGLPLVREDFFVDERYVIAMDWIEGRDLRRCSAPKGIRGSTRHSRSATSSRPLRRSGTCTRTSRPWCTEMSSRPISSSPPQAGSSSSTSGCLPGPRRAAAGGHGRVRGTRGRSGGETDLSVGCVLVRRHRAGSADR